MMPALTSLHIDRALTEVSIAYMNDSLIADVVAPPLPVDVRSNKYFVYDRATFLSTSGLDANNRPRSIRRPKTEAAEIDFTLSTDSYYTEEFALRDLVTDAEIAIADSPLQPDIDATYLVTERIKLDYEKFTATIVGTRSGYASGYTAQLTTGSTGTSWLSSPPRTPIRSRTSGTGASRSARVSTGKRTTFCSPWTAPSRSPTTRTTRTCI